LGTAGAVVSTVIDRYLTRIQDETKKKEIERIKKEAQEDRNRIEEIEKFINSKFKNPSGPSENNVTSIQDQISNNIPSNSDIESNITNIPSGSGIKLNIPSGRTIHLNIPKNNSGRGIE
jgi:galactokinase/mevalonate kinase-like predicted kinase